MRNNEENNPNASLEEEEKIPEIESVVENEQ